MTPNLPRVLVTSPADDLRAALESAGYGVVVATDLVADVVAIVVDVVKPSSAAAFTQRCRADAGERVVIVWVLPEGSPTVAAAGLDSGADACLTRPLDSAVLAAQLGASRRMRQAIARHAERADSTSLINDQLQAAYTESAAAVRLAARIRAAVLPPRPPTIGAIRFGVAHHDPTAVGLYDIVRLDEHHVAFWLADAGGRRSMVGELVRLAVRLAVTNREVTDAGSRLVPPAEVLDRVNRTLLRLNLDPTPFVGLAYGLIDVRSGMVSVARAGLPPAVYLAAQGEPEPWTGAGPFLGAFDAEFATREGVLRPGDKLLLVTGGEPGRVAEVAGRERGLPAQEMANTAARELECETAMVVEVATVD